MSAPWQWQPPEAPPSRGAGWRVAAVVIGLVLLAVVMVGALLATRTVGGEPGGAGNRTLPGEYVAGPVTLTNVEVREGYADYFEVYASAAYGGEEPFEADLEVDILSDERVIGSGSVTVNFNAAESHGATFVSFDDYDADFDQVIFRLADPLSDGLADLRTVEGDFTSGDFTLRRESTPLVGGDSPKSRWWRSRSDRHEVLTDVRIGEDGVGDFEVRGAVTYEGADPVEASLAVDIDGPDGNLGRATTAHSFERGQSLDVAFITTTGPHRGPGAAPIRGDGRQHRRRAAVAGFHRGAAPG